MPGKAISKLCTQARKGTAWQECLDAAIAAWKENKLLEKSKQKSLCTIANQMGVNHVTLFHATKPGYRSIQQFNTLKQLPPAIEDILVKFLPGLADMGLSMDPKMLTEKVNKIIQETIDPKHEGVNHNFTTHFFAQHENQLSTHWSSPLDWNHAEVTQDAVNNFFKQYQQVLHMSHISLQNQFAADETGIQLSFGCTKCVIGH